MQRYLPRGQSPGNRSRGSNPDMLHTGDLDVYIADFSQGVCEAPQLLTPFCVWLSYHSP